MERNGTKWNETERNETKWDCRVELPPGSLVPKLCLGTHVCEALLRASLAPGGLLSVRGSGASRPAFPSRAWERGSRRSKTEYEAACHLCKLAGRPVRRGAWTWACKTR